jgi:hypothetical protein
MKKLNSQNAQAMIETVIVISSVLLVMWAGMSFIAKCSNVKLEQEMELRRIMFNETSGSRRENIFLQSISTFLSDTVCCEKISTEEKCVKIPDLLNGGSATNSFIKYKSSIFILNGCWNKQQLVETLRNIQFKHGSVNDLKRQANEAAEYLKNFTQQEN